MRSRQRSQAVVEFGIVAITFTLIMFAIADFGLLLNDWLTVSSGVRTLARDAALGTIQNGLDQEARAIKIPGVTADPHFPGGYCCAANAALVLSVVYYDECTPGVGGCAPIADLSKLDNRYWSGGVQGGCSSWFFSPPVPCPHPAAPGLPGTCPLVPVNINPCPGDTVVVTLTAAGAQVITPLVRPFFTRLNECPDNSSPSRCYVPLSSTLTMRFEGDIL